MRHARLAIDDATRAEAGPLSIPSDRPREAPMPEPLGRQRGIERAESRRLLRHAPLGRGVQIHHPLRQTQSLDGERARPDYDRARALARGAAAVDDADTPDDLARLAFEIDAVERRMLLAVREERERPAADAAFDLAGAARTGHEDHRDVAQCRGRRHPPDLERGGRSRDTGEERDAREPAEERRHDSTASYGFSGRCWRRNCSISATTSEEAGSSSCRASGSASSSSSGFFFSSLVTYSAILAFWATIPFRFCSN